MYTVWVIEKREGARPSIAPGLMGDHAVRVFASLRTFEALVKFGQRRGPDLVVVDFEGLGARRDEIVAAVNRILGETPLVFVLPAGDQAPWGPGSVAEGEIWLPKPLDPLAFNRHINALVSRSATGSARRLRFKDVTLDYESLLLRVAASDTGQELPLKEAQLLRLFIEKAGICLSRDEIKRAVWRGVTVTSRNIDSYVSKLRTRLSQADATIESVYGGGYVFR